MTLTKKNIRQVIQGILFGEIDFDIDKSKAEEVQKKAKEIMDFLEEEKLLKDSIPEE
jgi:hypothetical protein